MPISSDEFKEGEWSNLTLGVKLAYVADQKALDNLKDNFDVLNSATAAFGINISGATNALHKMVVNKETLTALKKSLQYAIDQKKTQAEILIIQKKILDTKKEQNKEMFKEVASKALELTGKGFKSVIEYQRSFLSYQQLTGQNWTKTNIQTMHYLDLSKKVGQSIEDTAALVQGLREAGMTSIDDALIPMNQQMTKVFGTDMGSNIEYITRQMFAYGQTSGVVEQGLGQLNAVQKSVGVSGKEALGLMNEYSAAIMNAYRYGSTAGQTFQQELIRSKGAFKKLGLNFEMVGDQLKAALAPEDDDIEKAAKIAALTGHSLDEVMVAQQTNVENFTKMQLEAADKVAGNLQGIGPGIGQVVVNALRKEFTTLSPQDMALVQRMLKEGKTSAGEMAKEITAAREREAKGVKEDNTGSLAGAFDNIMTNTSQAIEKITNTFEVNMVQAMNKAFGTGGFLEKLTSLLNNLSTLMNKFPTVFKIAALGVIGVGLVTTLSSLIKTLSGLKSLLGLGKVAEAAGKVGGKTGPLTSILGSSGWGGMTGGLGMRGLLGTQMSTIAGGSLGAGSMVTTAGLVVGAGVLGYQIGKLWDKNINGPIEDKLNEIKDPTKREMAKVAMSIINPLYGVRHVADLVGEWIGGMTAEGEKMLKDSQDKLNKALGKKGISTEGLGQDAISILSVARQKLATGEMNQKSIASRLEEKKKAGVITAKEARLITEQLKNVTSNASSGVAASSNASSGVAASPGSSAGQGFDLGSFKEKIANIESGSSGGYLATNPDSSATGKYQFINKTAYDVMRKNPGLFSKYGLDQTSVQVNNMRNILLKNPSLQEDIMDAAVPEYVKTLQKAVGPGKVTEKMLAAAHFLSPGEAISYAKGQLDAEYNPTAGTGVRNASVGRYTNGFSDTVVAARGALVSKPTNVIAGDSGPELIAPVSSLLGHTRKTLIDAFMGMLPTVLPNEDRTLTSAQKAYDISVAQLQVQKQMSNELTKQTSILTDISNKLPGPSGYSRQAPSAPTVKKPMFGLQGPESLLFNGR